MDGMKEWRFTFWSWRWTFENPVVQTKAGSVTQFPWKNNSVDYLTQAKHGLLISLYIVYATINYIELYI